MTQNKIAFFSEGGYTGKIPRDVPMRTDQAWVCALDATHHCVFKLNEVKEKYDIGVVIIPKEKNREQNERGNGKEKNEREKTQEKTKAKNERKKRKQYFC